MSIYRTKNEIPEKDALSFFKEKRTDNIYENSNHSLHVACAYRPLDQLVQS